jgi:hypothetical protein
MNGLINLIKTGKLKLFLTPKSKTPYVQLNGKTICHTELKNYGFNDIDSFKKWYMNSGFVVFTK